MAITDRNIVITPNRTAVGNVQPKIVFTGADSSIGDSSAITLFANPENSGTLSFSGTAGQLFSITNNLTGTIFSVNDISGIPSLSVNDQGVIQLAEFNGRVIIGDSVGSDDSVSALQISGTITADSAIISGKLAAGVLEGKGGVTYDPPGTSGTDTSANVGLAVHSGKRIVLGENGFIRTIVDATWGSALKFGQSGTGAYAGTEIFGGGAGVSLYYSTTDRLETTDSGVNVNGNLRINNAPFPASAIAAGTIDSARLPTGTFTSGGGTDSAAVIALIDSAYVQARATSVTGTINNVKADARVGDGSNKVFNLSVTPADSDDVLVFVNGVLQNVNTYSLSGSTITLDSAPDSSSEVEFRTHLLQSSSLSLRDHKRFIYTLGSTLDSVSGADSAGTTLTYDADLVDVYVNGARLVNGKDYTAGNGTQIVFDSAFTAGNIVEVVSHSKATVLVPELTQVDINLTTNDSAQDIFSFDKAAFRTFKFTAQLSHNASSSFHSEEILLVHNGTSVAMTTYGQVLLDSNLGSFDALISGSNVQLKLSPTKTNIGVKLRGVRTPL